MYLGQDMIKGTIWLCSSNLANVASAKKYLLGAFPENLKQIPLIMTKIRRFKATYVIWF